MSDAEYARRMRYADVHVFLKMAELLGNDVKAAHAMREESKFILTHRGIPLGEEFAGKVRGWLMANRLEWNQENLEKAVAAVQTPLAAK